MKSIYLRNFTATALLVLTFAWGLKSFAARLDTAAFVRELFDGRETLTALFPLALFLVGGVLAFATGTSWGTFGILIPITLSVFPLTDPHGVVCVSACMAGAVCGDHCSPISDTTIMASAGAQCEHLDHVSTQLPYALTVAIVSFIGFIVAGFVQNVYITWLASAALLLGVLLFLRARERKQAE